MLNTSDYNNRIKALQSLAGKNIYYNWLVGKDFLKSHDWYTDIFTLNVLNTDDFPEYIFTDKTFIKSLFHREDLLKILNACDSSLDDCNNFNHRNFAFKSAMADIACSKDSLKHPELHVLDMNFIEEVGSDFIQTDDSLPQYGINKLALSKVSLNDSHHFENMKILANPDLSQLQKEYLFAIMTNSECIKSLFYKEELNAIVSAKDEVKLAALYLYITNFSYDDESDDMINYRVIDILNEHLSPYYMNMFYASNKNNLPGRKYNNYLDSLNSLIECDSNIVLFLSYLYGNVYYNLSDYQTLDLTF